MSRRNSRASWRATALVGAAALMIGAAATPARSQPTDRPVTEWIKAHAMPIATTDPAAPLDDLRRLSPAVGEATIVGLGEQVHGAKEVLQLKLRTIRLLVEEHGFRSIAWEDDWTLGLEIDSWIKTGEGDLDSLIHEMSIAHRNREVERTLRWLRDYNTMHPTDPVTFVGVEYWTTRQSAYDAVGAYVAAVAPSRLADARVHLSFLRPPGEDIGTWPQDYGALEMPDKEPFLQHARQLWQLILELPHDPGDREYSLAAHHARQIVNFYEHYALWPNFAYRDEHAAQNLRWWQRYSGDKVVYSAANAHTAVAPELEFYLDDEVAASWASVGSFLNTWYGAKYLSIGFTFDQGSYYQGQERILPPAAATWFEHVFAGVCAPQFGLDLRVRAPRPVQRWLNAPAQSRGYPEYGLASHMAGGTVDTWFDILVHRQVVTAAAPVGTQD